MHQRFSSVAVLFTLVVLALLSLAGVLLVAPGTESTQRLGLFFGVIGTSVAAIVALLRADQAQQRLNGGLDDRIESAVQRAQSTRRRQVAEENLGAAVRQVLADDTLRVAAADLATASLDRPGHGSTDPATIQSRP